MKRLFDKDIWDFSDEVKDPLRAIHRDLYYTYWKTRIADTSYEVVANSNSLRNPLLRAPLLNRLRTG